MRFLKLRQVLGMAESKMPGVPEANLDALEKEGCSKEFMIHFLQTTYGIKTMDYRSSLEYEFAKMDKQPKRQFIKNKTSRYPYYSFFTKDLFFLPMSKKIWAGDGMVGDSHWERFVQLFNEAMTVGNLTWKLPPGRDNGVHYERGEVEWESDDVLILVLAEMRHFRNNPYIENTEYQMWHHYRDDFVKQEMENRGYKNPGPSEFQKEEE